MDYEKIISCLPVPFILCKVPEGDIIFSNHMFWSLSEQEPENIFDILGQHQWHETLEQLQLGQNKMSLIVTSRVHACEYCATLCMVEDNNMTYAAVCISDFYTKNIPDQKASSQVLFEILANILSIKNTEDSIQYIIEVISKFYQASRVYIFEYATDKKRASNIYEWCRKGVQPQKEFLQNVEVEELTWTDTLMKEDMIVADNMYELAPKDVAVLEPQNIKSILVHSLKKDGIFWGFVGVDECDCFRKWTSEDIQLIQGVASVLSVLILRKHAEQKALVSHEMLTRVLDALDSLVFVADLEDSKLLFANKKLKYNLNDMFLEGKPCYSVLHDDQRAQCPFCPRDKLFDADGVPLGPYRWEYYNPKAEKWYYVSDEAICWSDGRYVHLEQATDITHIKENEQMMEMYAKMDIATGTYKRDWGIRKLEAMLQKRRGTDEVLCVCFLDMDGLKYINDNFGHDAGDKAIKLVAETIKTYIRSTDVICRMGGDEFLVIMNHCSHQNALAVMKQVDDSLQRINETMGYSFELSISKGVMEVSNKTVIDVNEIIKQADRKMYIEKNMKKQEYRKIYKNM